MNKFKSNLVSALIFSLTFVVGGFFISSSALASNYSLSSESFVTWNQGGITGYDAGFALNNATFDQASSVVIKLYSGETLLQTNTAISGKLTGSQFLTLFDTSLNFDYAKDGYFTNIKEAEYGKNLIPTKVVATVTIGGEVITATNANLNGKVLGANKFQFTQKVTAGSVGNEVMELQKYLNAVGFDCGVADGKYGPKTKAGIIKFQLANKLTGDGVVGPMTRSVLNK